MKFNFMISIVIPVYNAKDKMAKCLNSLINQSSNNFEVIFIDDCSTDGSYEYLKKFFKNAKMNVKIHQNEKNSGPGVSRNNGIKMSEGKYLMFIDSDDYITNDCIENLATASGLKECALDSVKKANSLSQEHTALSQEIAASMELQAASIDDFNSTLTSLTNKLAEKYND